MSIPAEYAPFLTAEFLGVLVLALVAPFRPHLSTHWLPVIGIILSLCLNVGIAFHLGLDPVLLGLMAVNTALVASGIYGWAKTASRVFKPPAH